MTDKVKCVLAICLTTSNLHNGFYIPSSNTTLGCFFARADILHRRNNSPDLMRLWNAFNCEAPHWSSHWSTHCWSNWEFIGDLINILRDLREHCKVTPLLCFTCFSSKTHNTPTPPPSYSYPGSSFSVGVEFCAISWWANDGLYIIAPPLNPLHNWHGPVVQVSKKTIEPMLQPDRETAGRPGQL